MQARLWQVSGRTRVQHVGEQPWHRVRGASGRCCAGGSRAAIRSRRRLNEFPPLLPVSQRPSPLTPSLSGPGGLNTQLSYESGAATLWHEMLHHLGLRHTFSTSGSCSEDTADGIPDTPLATAAVYSQPWAMDAYMACQRIVQYDMQVGRYGCTTQGAWPQPLEPGRVVLRGTDWSTWHLHAGAQGHAWCVAYGMTMALSRPIP